MGGMRERGKGVCVCVRERERERERGCMCVILPLLHSTNATHKIHIEQKKRSLHVSIEVGVFSLSLLPSLTHSLTISLLEYY